MEASRLVLDSQSWTIPQLRTSWAYRKLFFLFLESHYNPKFSPLLCVHSLIPSLVSVLSMNLFGREMPHTSSLITLCHCYLKHILSFYCCYIYSFAVIFTVKSKKSVNSLATFSFPILLLGAVLQSASNQSETMVSSFFHFHLLYQLHFWLFHHNTKWIWT